ncbi:uncharacterized protein LY79DRAFT_336294 [Colletotrichum navitas]|uniref:Uncharacterized protein n=1 Tax=Colletotrichum navitas TaxID=681940 RepID=A0AAD8PSZ4_9PEZI|nr:uncharacterized protein LY79DRAFT_336294 [Colletotrichum navitas]KAK1579672.1 hypothetical protein LY79DRAFT_336294 [Colletotrichum navitas]
MHIHIHAHKHTYVTCIYTYSRTHARTDVVLQDHSSSGLESGGRRAGLKCLPPPHTGDSCGLVWFCPNRCSLMGERRRRTLLDIQLVRPGSSTERTRRRGGRERKRKASGRTEHTAN